MFRYRTSTMSFPKLFRTMEMRGEISPEEEEKIKKVAEAEAEIRQIEEFKIPELQRNISRLHSSDELGYEADSLKLESYLEYFNALGRLDTLRDFIILAQRE